MFEVAVKSNMGDVVVKTTESRGLSPEELAERAVEQIVGISASVDPVVRQQAEAFKSQIQQIVLYYMKQSAKSERTTIYNLLLNAGEASLAEHIRRL